MRSVSRNARVFNEALLDFASYTMVLANLNALRAELATA